MSVFFSPYIFQNFLSNIRYTCQDFFLTYLLYHAHLSYMVYTTGKIPPPVFSYKFIESFIQIYYSQYLLYLGAFRVWCLYRYLVHGSQLKTILTEEQELEKVLRNCHLNLPYLFRLWTFLPFCSSSLRQNIVLYLQRDSSSLFFVHNSTRLQSRGLILPSKMTSC